MAQKINLSRFNRLILRSAEIAAEPGMHKLVVHVHTDKLAVPGDAFIKAHAAVTAYESAWTMNSYALREVLEQFDAPYRMARSGLVAYEPGRKLPETLKAQRTDTDKLFAIEELYAAVAAHAGKAWADELLLGEFGSLAPKAKAALETSIATAKDLAKAREDRMTAYTGAYAPFLAFKRVVRDTLGSRSKQYHRIHLRSRGDSGIEPDDNTPEDVAPSFKQAA